MGQTFGTVILIHTRSSLPIYTPDTKNASQKPHPPWGLAEAQLYTFVTVEMLEAGYDPRCSVLFP